MTHVKVVNDATDLIIMLRAFDKPVKKEVFDAVQEEWLTISDVEKKFGKEGAEALNFFDKSKLVETRWNPPQPGGRPEKAYHAYYSTLYLKLSSPISLLSEVFVVASMDEEKFKELEESVYEYVGKNGEQSRNVVDDLNLSYNFLRSLVNRSDRLSYRGMCIERA